MAKVGEGDERWIVQERDDGKNVNNWHWSEKDVSAWAHTRLAELLREVQVTGTSSTGVSVIVNINKVDPVEGDATLYNRKGQLRTLHDLKVTAKWKGMAGREPAKGTLKFELYDDAPDVTFLADESSPAADACKQILKATGNAQVTRVVQTFVQELTLGANALDPATVSKSTRKPASSKPSAVSAVEAARATPTPSSASPPAAPAANQTKTSDAPEAKHTLRITEQFRCSPTDLFRSLVDAERVSGYTMKPADISQEPGGAFSIAAGQVTGKQVKIVPGKQIVQKWRMSSYPAELHTDVAITIHDKEDHVILELVQKGIPQSLMHSTENQWRVETFQRMKVVLGYGSARLF